MPGEQTVILHPHDAVARGISTGQYVQVFDDRGRFVARAEVNTEIAPGVAVSPMGAWRRNARHESAVSAVNPVVLADLGNAPTFSDSRVEVTLV